MDYADRCFKEGEEVSAINFPDDSQYVVGQGGVERITVVMEYGQMAGVPWFAIWREGKVDQKVNSVHVAVVSL
jgi:hypothetical protein